MKSTLLNFRVNQKFETLGPLTLPEEPWGLNHHLLISVKAFCGANLSDLGLDRLSHLVADFIIVVNGGLYVFIDRCEMIDISSMHNCSIESLGVALFELGVNEAGQLIE